MTKNKMLTGTLGYELSKAVFQKLVKSLLKESDVANDIAYYLAGNLINSKRGIEHAMLLVAGETIEELFEVGQYLKFKNNNTVAPDFYVGKIVAVDPFSWDPYKVEYARSYDTKMSKVHTRTLDIGVEEEASLVDVHCYNSIVDQLKEKAIVSAE